MIDLHEVVTRLNGPIEPIGDSRVDEARFQHLVDVCDLVNRLLSDIDEVASENKDAVEHSRRKAGEYASAFFDSIGVVK